MMKKDVTEKMNNTVTLCMFVARMYYLVKNKLFGDIILYAGTKSCFNV